MLQWVGNFTPELTLRAEWTKSRIVDTLVAYLDTPQVKILGGGITRGCPLG